MEPQRRAQMDANYYAALEATRKIHKRERIRRTVEEEQDEGLSAAQE